MRNLRTVTIVLLTCLAATAESFVAWSKHEKKIAARRKDYGDYFPSGLDSPPRSLDSEPPASSRETCLYVSPDLPQCDFDRYENSAERNEESRENYQQIYDRPKSGSIASSKVRRAAEKGHIVVYTIEGCLPERLPFDMPACKDEDFIDGLFEVRKLYPFRVKATSSQETFVFPEFNFGQWLKMMRRFDEQRQSPSSASVAEGVGVKAETNDEEVARHRQSVLISTTKRKMMMPRATIASRYVSKGSPLNSFIVHRGASEAETNERRGNTDDLVLLEFRPLLDSFNRARNNHEDRLHAEKRWREKIFPAAEHDWSFNEAFNDLGSAGQIDSLPVSFREARDAPARTRRDVIGKGSEFPYSKAIPFDPKKLGQQPRKTREIPRDDPKFSESTRAKYPKTLKTRFAKGKRGKSVLH